MYQEHYETGAGFYKDIGAAGAGAASSEEVVPETNPNTLRAAGPQVSCLVSPDPAPHELRLLAQMGVTRCFTWLDDPEQETVEHIRSVRERCAAEGVQLYNVATLRLAKNAAIILGDDEGGRREAAIGEFCGFLATLGEAGIGVTTFTWEPDGVWSVAKALTRGRTEARAMEASAMTGLPPSHGREYDDEELWATMRHFLERALPAAEAAGVRLALHPNDPPMDALVCGVRPLMRSRGAFDRAFGIARDLGREASLGMEFCCGCWLEGGAAFGDVYSDLENLVAQGRVCVVHLRNVTSPLPSFVETFLDGGYGDVCRLLDILVRGGYGGTVILDHTPPFVPEAGPAAASAFAVGYMKAGIRAAQAAAEREAAAARPAADAAPPADA